MQVGVELGRVRQNHNVAMQQDFDKAAEVISELEKQIS